MTTPAPRSWTTGFTLLLASSFIGLLTIVLDLPRWLDLTIVVLIIVLVFIGSRMAFSKRGGWQPSKTLPEQPTDHEH